MARAPLELSSALAPDTALGRWARDNYGVHPKSQVLGQGTFGVVVAGCRLVDYMSVAVKIQRVEPITLAMELSGAQLMADFPHQNLLVRMETFHDVRQQIFASVSPQAHFDLRMMLHNTTTGGLNVLGAALVQSLSADLVHGVAHLHRLNIIHRDIKPGNCVVYVAPESTHMRLGDFGCSRVEDAGGMTPGLCTSWYRAPELFIKNPVDAETSDCADQVSAYTRAVDVWSVGCVVAEMLACKELFAESTDAKVARLIRARLGLLGVEQPGLLKDIRFPWSHKNIEQRGKDFFLQCLQFEPTARPLASNLRDHPLVFKHGCVHRMEMAHTLAPALDRATAMAGGLAPGAGGLTPGSGGLAPGGPGCEGTAGALGDAAAQAGGLAPGTQARAEAPNTPVRRQGVEAGGAETAALPPACAAPSEACKCTGFCAHGKSSHTGGCPEAPSPRSQVCLSCRCKVVRKQHRCPPKVLEASSESDADSSQAEDPRLRLGIAPGEQCPNARRKGNTCVRHAYTNWSMVLRICRRLGRMGLLRDMLPCDVEGFLAAKGIHHDLVLQFIAAWLKHPVAISALNTFRPDKKSYTAMDLMKCLHRVRGPQPHMRWGSWVVMSG